VRTWRIGNSTPASTCRSRSVAEVGVPSSVGGPEKNDVSFDALTQSVGRHRSYA
jgi:hypothetical protein